MADGVIYYKKEDAESIMQVFAELAEEPNLSVAMLSGGEFNFLPDSYADGDALGVLDASLFSGLTQSSMYWKIWEALSSYYDSTNPLTAAALKENPDFTYLIQSFDLDPASLLLNVPGYFIRYPEKFESVSDVVLRESPVEIPTEPITSKENIQDKIDHQPSPDYPSLLISIDVASLIDESVYLHEEACTVVSWDDVPPVVEALLQYFNSQKDFDWHSPNLYPLTQSEWDSIVSQFGVEYDLDTQNSWQTLLDMVSAEISCPDTLGQYAGVDFGPDVFVLTAKGVDAYVQNPKDFYLPYVNHPIATKAIDEASNIFPVELESVDIAATVTVRQNHRIDLTPQRSWLPSQLLYVDILKGATLSTVATVNNEALQFDPNTPTIYLNDVFLNARPFFVNTLDLEIKALQVSYDATGHNGKLFLVLDRHDYDDLDESGFWNFLEKTVGDFGGWLQKKVGLYDSVVKIDATSLIKTILGEDAAGQLLNTDGTLKLGITTQDLIAALTSFLKIPAKPESEKGFVDNLKDEVVSHVQDQALDMISDLSETISVSNISATYFPEDVADTAEGFHIESLSLLNGMVHGSGSLPDSFFVEGVFPTSLQGFYVDADGIRENFDIPELTVTLTVDVATREAQIKINGEDLPLPLQSLLGSTRGTVDPLVVDIPGIETGTIDLSGLDRLAQNGNNLDVLAQISWPDFDISNLANNNWAGQIHYALSGFFKEKTQRDIEPSHLSLSTAGDVLVAKNEFVTAQVAGEVYLNAKIEADKKQSIRVENGFYTGYLENSQNWGGALQATIDATQGKAGLQADTVMAAYDEEGVLHAMPRLDAVSSLGVASKPFHFGITDGEIVFAPNGDFTTAELSLITPLAFYTQNLELPIYDKDKKILGHANLGPSHGLIAGAWSVGGSRLADIVNTDLYGEGHITLLQGMGIDVDAGPEAHFTANPDTVVSLHIGGVNLSDGIPGLLYNGSIKVGLGATGLFQHFSWQDIGIHAGPYELNFNIETPGVAARAHARPITLLGLRALNELHTPSPEELHESKIDVAQVIASELDENGQRQLAAEDFDVNDAAKLAGSVERFMVNMAKGDIDWSDEFETRLIKGTSYLEVPLNSAKPTGVKMLIPLVHYVDEGHRILGEKYKLSALDIELTKPIYIELKCGLKIPLNGIKLVTRAQLSTRRERRGEIVEISYANGQKLIVKFYNEALTRLSPEALLRNAARILQFQPQSYEVMRLDGKLAEGNDIDVLDLIQQVKPSSAKNIPYVNTVLLNWGESGANRARIEIFQTDFEGLSQEEQIDKVKAIVLGDDKSLYRIMTLNVGDVDLPQTVLENNSSPELMAFENALNNGLPMTISITPEQERVFLNVDGRSLTLDVNDSHLYATGLFGLRSALRKEIAKGNYTVVSYEDEAGNSLGNDEITADVREELTVALNSGKFCGVKLEDRNAYQRGRHVLIAKVGILRFNILSILDLVGFFQSKGPLDVYNKTFYKNLKEKYEWARDLPRNSVPTKIEDLVVFVKELIDLFKTSSTLPQSQSNISPDFFVGILGVIFDSLVVQLDDAVINSAKLADDTVVSLGEAGEIRIHPDGPFTLEGSAELHVRGNTPTHGEISLAGGSSEALPRVEIDLHHPNDMQLTLAGMHNIRASADFNNGLNNRPAVSFSVEDARVLGPLGFAFKDTLTQAETVHFKSEEESYVRGDVSYTYTPVYDEAGNLVAQLHVPVVELKGERSVVLGGAKIFFTSGKSMSDNGKPLSGYFNAGDVFEISDGHMNFSFKVEPATPNGNLNEGLAADRVTISTMDIDLPFTQTNGQATLNLGSENRNLNFKDLDVASGRIKVETKPDKNNVMTPEFKYIFDNIRAALDIPSDPRIDPLNLHIDPLQTALTLKGDGTIRLFGPEGGISETKGTYNPLQVVLTGPVVVPIDKAGAKGFLKIDELVIHVSDLQFEMLPDPEKPGNMIPSVKSFTGYIVGQGSVELSYPNINLPPQPWRMATRETTMSFGDIHDWNSLSAATDGFGLSIGVKGDMAVDLELGETRIDKGQVVVDSLALDAVLHPYFKDLLHGLLQTTARVGVKLNDTNVDLTEMLMGIGKK